MGRGRKYLIQQNNASDEIQISADDQQALSGAVGEEPKTGAAFTVMPWRWNPTNPSSSASSAASPLIGVSTRGLPFISRSSRTAVVQSCHEREWVDPLNCTQCPPNSTLIKSLNSFFDPFRSLNVALLVRYYHVGVTTEDLFREFRRPFCLDPHLSSPLLSSHQFTVKRRRRCPGAR